MSFKLKTKERKPPDARAKKKVSEDWQRKAQLMQRLREDETQGFKFNRGPKTMGQDFDIQTRIGNKELQPKTEDDTEPSDESREV